MGFYTVNPATGLSECLVATAGGVLSALKVVVINDAGKAVYADKDTLTHMFRVVGITTTTATADASITIRRGGEQINNTWAWVLGSPIFLGNNGELTQTAPTTGFQCIVGRPETSIKILVGVELPIKLA